MLFSAPGFAQKAVPCAHTTADVRIFGDSAIAVLAMHENTIANLNEKAKGYRIQIYNGTNRQEAKLIQENFRRTHPSIAAYFIYYQPNFRVRVGDFLSRADAQKLYAQLQKQYTCIIVPVIVNITR